MTRRNVYLTRSFHKSGLDAVTHAHSQFDELIALPIPEALNAAKDLKDSSIFIEALVIGYGNPQAARDRLRSHFYVNQIIDVNRLFTFASRKIRTYAIAFIIEGARKLLQPISAPFKGISKPVEPRSLSVEMDLLLNTIRAAHAPTAARGRSTLHPVNS